MKIIKTFLIGRILFLFVVVSLFSSAKSWAQSNASNPVIWTDVPGPLVLRVDETLFTPQSTSIENPDESQPAGFHIGKNYPNPFNLSTQINYIIDRTTNVRIDEFNVSGRHASFLVNEKKPLRSYAVTFDTENLASSLYLLSYAGWRLFKNPQHDFNQIIISI